LWRKQILPREKINTIDRVTGEPVTLDFNDNYYADLINSFKANAFDQIAFQLSDGEKGHNENPERFRGELVDLEITPNGLDGVLRLTEEGSKVVRNNPKLGVSVKVIEGLVRGDGKTFPRALKHIAGLLDPAATGMSPWQEVALAAEGVDATMDLSKEVYGMTVPNGGGATPPVPAGDGGGGSGGSGGTGAPPGTPTPPAVVPPVPPVAPVIDDTSDDTNAQAWLAALNAAGAADLSRQHADSDRVTQLEAELAALRFEQGAAQLERDGVPPALIQLARDRVGYLELQVARQRYENEAFAFIEAGVPPSMLEIARLILELPMAPTVELSRDGQMERINTGDVVRRLLEEAKGLIGMHRELGSTVGKDMAAAREDELLVRWAKELGS